jgi:predicted phosphodiesterase
MKEPIRVLSDLHLGHRVSRIGKVEALRPLIAGAGTVIFNGDTWQELALPFKDRSAAMLEELRAICREEGAEAIFLSGNHDPGWDGPGWIELADKRILITHGDALFFSGSPWSREALNRRQQIAELWRKHRAAECHAGERLRLARQIARSLVPPHFPKGKKLWQRVWEAAHPPSRAFHMLHSWLTQADAAVDFAEQFFPKAEIILIGHFHLPGVWNKDGRTVINTGAFLPPCKAWCVEIKSGWVSCSKITENSDACTIEPAFAHWRF